MKQAEKTRPDTHPSKAPPHGRKPLINLAPATIIMIFLALVLATFLPSSLDTPASVATAHPPTFSTIITPPRPTPTAIPTPPPISPFPTTFAQQLEVMQAKGRYFAHGNTQLPEIALTFDDGPNGPYTAQILDILQHYHVKATFFCVGSQVQKYPALVQQAYKAGHLIANHTWAHPYLPNLTVPSIIWQITTTSDIIQRTTGVRPTLFRAPYGATNSTALNVINLFGLTLIQWNVDPQDWSRPGMYTIYARVMAQTQNGSIILLHDGGGDRSQTAAALPMIIQRLQSEGFQFVTLQKLIQDTHESAPHKKTPRPTPTQNAHGPIQMRERQQCMIKELNGSTQGCG